MGKDGRPYIAVRKRLGMKREDQKKPAADVEKKEDFFPVWQKRQGVVEEEEVEEEGDMEEYLAKREDWRYYIGLRKKKEESEGKVETEELQESEGMKEEVSLEEEEVKEEGDMEEYLAKGEDGRYYIGLRKKKEESEGEVETEELQESEGMKEEESLEEEEVKEEGDMEEYLAKGEDGRYYIGLRKKKEESEDEVETEKLMGGFFVTYKFVTYKFVTYKFVPYKFVTMTNS